MSARKVSELTPLAETFHSYIHVISSPSGPFAIKLPLTQLVLDRLSQEQVQEAFDQLYWYQSTLTNPKSDEARCVLEALNTLELQRVQSLREKPVLLKDLVLTPEHPDPAPVKPSSMRNIPFSTAPCLDSQPKATRVERKQTQQPHPETSTPGRTRVSSSTAPNFAADKEAWQCQSQPGNFAQSYAAEEGFWQFLATMTEDEHSLYRDGKLVLHHDYHFGWKLVPARELRAAIQRAEDEQPFIARTRSPEYAESIASEWSVVNSPSGISRTKPSVSRTNAAHATKSMQQAETSRTKSDEPQHDGTYTPHQDSPICIYGAIFDDLAQWHSLKAKLKTHELDMLKNHVQKLTRDNIARFRLEDGPNAALFRAYRHTSSKERGHGTRSYGRGTLQREESAQEPEKKGEAAILRSSDNTGVPYTKLATERVPNQRPHKFGVSELNANPFLTPEERKRIIQSRRDSRTAYYVVNDIDSSTAASASQ